ncbi:MAG: tetratricopeptide repeat protein [Nisaea sp.]|uniref:tetratricopeptide repeat protein n=1 Tax=Nisaea sp. TaxID=2024842 RepID=UPI001B0D980D|nr:tetratricopeptide repeat protein [Nisaea sp.]MBO6562217.1 tetratricopeptide repeat protein [Nisaea sp.]
MTRASSGDGGDPIGRLKQELQERAGGQNQRAARRSLAMIDPPEAGRWAALAGGWPERGHEFLSRAIVADPEDFRLYVNLSNKMLQRGAVPAAVAALKRAALLEPGDGRVFGNLGALSESAAKARKLHARAWVSSSASGPGAGCAMAERQLERGRVVEALENVLAALRQDPKSSEAWRLRGIIHQRFHEIPESRLGLCRSILCDPSAVNGYIAAAGNFIDSRKLLGARRLLGFADIVAPGTQAVAMNRAAIVERSGDLDGALALSRGHVIADPANAERYFTVGTIHMELGSVDAALKYLMRATQLAPEDLRFQNNLALALLKLGRYAEGLKVYENRWYTPVEAPLGERTLWPKASFDLPLWESGRIADREILIWGEQGLGDEVWGLSYLTALRGRPEHFTVEVDARLVPLVERSFPFVKVVPRRPDADLDISGFHSQLPLLSLPHKLGLEMERTPSAWLQTDPGRVARLRRTMSADGRYRLVGLAWRSIKPLQHRSFEMEIERFASLSALERIRFVPLQYGMVDADRNRLEAVLGDDRIAWPEFDVRDDLEALAEALAAIDLVATVATALVPMANAVGTPSVVLLREQQKDWRYRVGAELSPVLPLSVLQWPSDATPEEALLDAVTLRLPTDHGG